MKTTRYWECVACGWTYDSNTAGCTECEMPTARLTEVVELQGRALDGNKEYRLDTELAIELNRTRGSEVKILIKKD